MNLDGDSGSRRPPGQDFPLQRFSGALEELIDLREDEWWKLMMGLRVRLRVRLRVAYSRTTSNVSEAHASYDRK